MIRITLNLLGPFRSGPSDPETLTFKEGTRLSEALLPAELPGDVPRVVLLNGAQRADDPVVRDGDTITVFPPIAGGCAGPACKR